MTTQPNKGITFAAPAAIQIRRRPCALSMSQFTRSPSFGPAAAPVRRRRAGHRERMRPQGYVSWKCRKMLRGAGPETGPHSAISRETRLYARLGRPWSRSVIAAQ